MTAAAPTPRVSVCVSSRNRRALLERLLHALPEQTLDPTAYDVVVTDDGSDDGTGDMLRRVAAELPYRLHVLGHPRSLGPAAGRNAAWRAASGEVIAFTDDDCLPAPGWLAAGLAAFAPGEAVVVGRVEPNPDQMQHYDLFAHSWVMRESEKRAFATCNIFYRRAHLDALGGFDERYRNPACEDTDLGLRAEERGAEILFATDALVWHDVRPGRAIDKVRDQARWADLPLIFRDHPDARRLLLHRNVFWKRSHEDLLVLLAGLAGSVLDRRALLLALPWLHRRLCADRGDNPLSMVAPALPALLAVDVAEVVAMVRGSIKHRSLML